jgi:hypothetical protein
MTAERPMADAQKTSAARIAVGVFGGLGLIPFYLPMLAPVMAPVLTTSADRAQTLYAGVILSFLGGARFGRAVEREGPVLDVALAMAPPLLAFGALFLTPPASRLVLIASLFGQLAWDASTKGLSRHYRAIRAVLTAAAVAALGLGLVAFR